MMLTVGLVALALGAQSAQTEVKTLTMHSLAGAGDKKALVQARPAPRVLHELHAHVGPDGQTVVNCELSHERVVDMREVLRANAEQH